jgi:hypothetical protein
MATVESPISLDPDDLTRAEAEFLVGSPVGDAPFDADGALEAATQGPKPAYLVASPRASPSGPACCSS